MNVPVAIGGHQSVTSDVTFLSNEKRTSFFLVVTERVTEVTFWPVTMFLFAPLFRHNLLCLGSFGSAHTIGCLSNK